MPLPTRISESTRRLNPQLFGIAPAPTKLVAGIVMLDVAKKRKSHAKNRDSLSHAKFEQDQAAALGAAIQGKTESVPRTTVRFTGYRVRPLDPDNFAGSVKDLLDGLRHADLIPGDEPWRIRLETEQVKVATFNEERTEIEIDTT